MAFLTFLPFLLKIKGADLPTIGFALLLVFAGGAMGKLGAPCRHTSSHDRHRMPDGKLDRARHSGAAPAIFMELSGATAFDRLCAEWHVVRTLRFRPGFGGVRKTTARVRNFLYRHHWRRRSFACTLWAYWRSHRCQHDPRTRCGRRNAHCSLSAFLAPSIRKFAYCLTTRAWRNLAGVIRLCEPCQSGPIQENSHGQRPNAERQGKEKAEAG